jgi:hypothetical protein
MSSAFATGTAPALFTKSVGSFANSASISKTQSFFTGSMSTTINTVGVPSSPTIRPFTKPSLPFVINSTSVVTSAFPSGIYPTEAPSNSIVTPKITYASSVVPIVSSFNSTSIFSDSSTAKVVSSTASQIPTASRSRNRPHNHQKTVTVTVTALPNTVTIGGTTVTTTDFVTATPPINLVSSVSSILDASNSSAVDTTTIFVTAPASTSMSIHVPTTLVTKIVSSSIIASSSAASTATAASSTTSGLPTMAPIKEYYQCGGLNWKGEGACADGMVCKEWNPYYSQCIDKRYA